MSSKALEPLAVSSAKSKITFLANMLATISCEASQTKLYPFDKAIAVLNKDIERINDKNLQYLLAELWLKRYSLYIDEPFNALLKFPAMESCITCLTRHESALDLLPNEEYAAAIAHLCIRRVGYNITGAPSNNSLKLLFEQITGKDVNDEVLESVKQTVDLLYGSSVWTLYSEEADTSFDLGNLLWSAGIKPHCIIRRANKDLPGVLSNVTWEL